MIRTWKALTTITFLALGLLALGSAQAQDEFKGRVRGDATFAVGDTPDGGFGTINADGHVTVLKSKGGGHVTVLKIASVVLAMAPNKNPEGGPARGFSGVATLTAANGDRIDMDIDTDSPDVTTRPGSATAEFEGTSVMTGGTGRFAGASLESNITITIKCISSPRPKWTITIEW